MMLQPSSCIINLSDDGGVNYKKTGDKKKKAVLPFFSSTCYRVESSLMGTFAPCRMLSTTFINKQVQ